MAISMIPMVEKDCGIRLQAILPLALAGTLPQHEILYLCGLYRRIAVCKLFLLGRPEGFFRHLSSSARAFASFLHTNTDAVKATAQSAPFYDAIAAGDHECARRIAFTSRTTWHEGKEYEDDFLHVSFLMRCFFQGAGDDELGLLLDRYQTCLEGGSDPRLDICRALHAREAQDFNDALADLMNLEASKAAARLARDQLDPDAAATTAKISIEGIALTHLAERRGLAIRRDYRLIPSLARMVQRASPPEPDGWMSYVPFS